MNREKLLKRFKEFCGGLKQSDRIALVHHSDPDGFCSALIAMKAVEKITGKPPKYILHYEYANREQFKALLRAVKKKRLNKLLVVDIGVDSDSQRKEMLAPFEKVLVVDHHKIYHDLNSKRVVLVKAQWLSKMDPARYACSKLCFDVFKKIVNIEKMDWAACIGILGDMCFSTWKEFVKKVSRRRKLRLDEMYYLMDLVAATEVMAEHRMNTLLLEFYNAKNPKELLKSGFKKYVDSMKKERDRLLSGFAKKALYYPKLELLLYEIKTRREGIKSYVANEISAIYPNKTVVLIQDAGNGDLRISARRHDYKVKMNEVLEHSVKGIPKANAGGHVPAAAARIRKKYREKFKKNLFRELVKSKN